MTISLESVRLGAQRPRVLSVPRYSSTAGDEAIELAESAGLILDDWQAFVLRESLGEDAYGNWAAFEVGLVVSRQNGKGSILEARELAGLYLFDDKLIMHSAHDFKTAAEAFVRILTLIESTPDLDSKVSRVSRSHGDEGIELKNGARLKFVARSNGSGRGFSADCVILDEAFNLSDMSMSSMMPTLSARRNPQIWYTSSAVNANEHANGWVLTRVRDRGIKGDDPALAYFEWSVDDADYEADADSVALDPAQWAKANPGLGIRITEEYIEREQRAMTRQGFAVERLGVGVWPTEARNAGVIDLDTWAALSDPDADPPTSPVFALDVSPDRSSAAVCAAGRRSDGLAQIAVVEHKSGTGWIVDRLKGLTDEHRAEVVVDPGGPAGSLIPDLERASIPIRLMRTRDVVQAFGMFVDACANDDLRHLGQPSLTTALSGARKRDLAGGGSAWSRQSVAVDISPLVASTNALWGVGTVEPEPDYDITLSIF